LFVNGIPGKISDFIFHYSKKSFIIETGKFVWTSLLGDGHGR